MDNVIVSTEVEIPLYVRFIASLGSNFNYCGSTVGDDPWRYCVIYNEVSNYAYLHNVLRFAVVYERVKESVGDYAELNIVNSDQKKFFEKCEANSFRERSTTPTKAQLFINLQMERTKRFLKLNQNVRIIPADKGGKVVITDGDTYKQKMNDYVTSCIRSQVYFRFDSLPLEYVKFICETKYNAIREKVEEIFTSDASLGLGFPPFRLPFEPFVVPRIYGLYKVHKLGNPIRPIVSATNPIGKSVSEWMLSKLNVIANHLREYRIKSAHECFQLLDGTKLLETSHRLFVLDFDNMFTNIPFSTTKEIIRKLYCLIKRETTMPADMFLMILSFVIEECSFFMYDGTLYLQAEGLTMGNSLSQVLAEITTSFVLNEIMSKYCGRVSFLFKYVDDLISASDAITIIELKKEIEHRLGMSLKLTSEDESSEVEFLQMKVGRHGKDGDRVYFRWTQKEYSARKILDFHSFHPLRMKLNVVNEFIRSALRVTTAQFWNVSINALKKVLSNSNYPYYFICESVSLVKKRLLLEIDVSSGENRDSINKKDRKYVSCPYVPSKINFVRRTIQKLKRRDVSLSPLISNNNRNLIFANLKDEQSLLCVVNASFKVRCDDCEFCELIFSTHKDVQSTFDATLSSTDSRISQHCLNSRHSARRYLMRSDVTVYRNKMEATQAKAFKPS